MTLIIALTVIGLVVVTCFKAYHSTKLLEKDVDAWTRLQQAEDEKRQRRQAMVGKAVMSFWEMIFGKKE